MSIVRPHQVAMFPQETSPRLDWVAHPDETWRRALRDAALSLVTLGISRFWTTTAHRRRLWSSVRVDGVAMRYSGTPVDLALPAIFAVLGATIAIVIMYKTIGLRLDPHGGIRLPDVSAMRLGRLGYMVPLLILIGMARYRARHFILRRVWLGELGGRMTGRPVWFGPRHLFATLTMAPTLFWIAPFRAVWLHTKLVRETEVAGERLQFTPTYGGLYAKFAVAWFGMIGVYLAMNVALAATVGTKIVAAVDARTWPAFTTMEWVSTALIAAAGIVAFATVLAWYRAHELLHLWRATGWRGQAFELALTPGAIVRLTLENALLRIVTLGLLDQVAVTRSMRAMTLALRIAPQPRPARFQSTAAARGAEQTPAQPHDVVMA